MHIELFSSSSHTTHKRIEICGLHIVCSSWIFKLKFTTHISYNVAERYATFLKAICKFAEKDKTPDHNSAHCMVFNSTLLIHAENKLMCWKLYVINFYSCRKKIRTNIVLYLQVSKTCFEKFDNLCDF